MSMTPERELWACALEMIRQHGDDAGVRVAMKADALLEAGELDGASRWQAILRRVSELQRSPPSTVQ